MVCNVVAAALDVFSLTLLVPFLNALFGAPSIIPTSASWISSLQDRMLGAFLNPADKLGSVETMMVAIMIIVALKNVFVWLGGQFGAALQENVTRDLRDGVFRHLQRLPLGYFQRTKTGQIISRVLADTEQTKALITELVTRTLQNVAQIVGTIVILLNYSVRLTFVALVIAPLLTLSLQPVLRKLRKGHRRLRGDYGEITVGDRTSIQDGTVIHSTYDLFTHVGSDCVIGHNVHLEGCTIEDKALVGSGSIVLHRAIVRTGGLVGAGAVVSGGTEVPSGAMALGIPAKIKPDCVTPDMIQLAVDVYVENAKRYPQLLKRLD